MIGFISDRFSLIIRIIPSAPFLPEFPIGNRGSNPNGTLNDLYFNWYFYMWNLQQDNTDGDKSMSSRFYSEPDLKYPCAAKDHNSQQWEQFIWIGHREVIFIRKAIFRQERRASPGDSHPSSVYTYTHCISPRGKSPGQRNGRNGGLITYWHKVNSTV